VWARLFWSFAWSHLSYKKVWNSFISLPFLHNGLLEIPVDLASCRKSRWPCSIKSPPASQAEALDVEILLSSQGSRILNMEKSSIVYWFLVRAHNLQILRFEQGSAPRIDQSFLLRFSLLLTQTSSVAHWACSFFPHHGRFFRPLSLNIVSIMTVRRHDVALPSSSATVFTTPRLHELTMLSSVLSMLDTRMDKRPLQPRSGYKRKLFTKNRRCESSISIQDRCYHCSCSSSS
jgi:hypothetical protein